MTTIVYNGHMLVADSRRTSADDTQDDASKLLLIEPGLTYEDSPVLAFAACGRTDVIAAMLKQFLQRGPEDFLTFYQELLKSGLAGNHHNTRFFFVTGKNGYGLQVEGRAGARYDRLLPANWQERAKDGKLDFAAFGSGKREVTALTSLFSMPPILAVACLGVVGEHTGTGGHVNYVRFEDGKVAGAGMKAFKSSHQIMEKVHEHLRSDQCRPMRGNFSLTITSRAPKTGARGMVMVSPKPASEPEQEPKEDKGFFAVTLPEGVKVYKHVPSAIPAAGLELSELLKQSYPTDLRNRLIAFQKERAHDFSCARAVVVNEGTPQQYYVPADFYIKVVDFIKKLTPRARKKGGK